MGDQILATHPLPQLSKKSLNLQPLEQLKKAIEKNSRDNTSTRLQYFEIEVPSQKTQLTDIIYPLIELGITKAKIYVTKISDEAINQIAVITPIVRQTLWDKFKYYLTWFNGGAKTHDNDKYIIIEEDDYMIIQPAETETNESIRKENDAELSSSLLESSLIVFDTKKLKSLNVLKAKDELEQSDNIGFCKSMVKKDFISRNSFSSSLEESITFAPIASSSSFRAFNCLAAEFELVGNNIIVQDIEGMLTDRNCEAETEENKIVI